jgi:hypothetical protein
MRQSFCGPKFPAARLAQHMRSIFTLLLVSVFVILSPRAFGSPRTPMSAPAAEAYQLLGTDRLNVLSPRHPLIAGEPNALLLEYANYKGRGVSIDWGRRLDGHILWNGTIEPLSIMYGPDGRPFVNLVPMHTGEWVVHLIVSFTDGGVDTKDVEVSVILPERKPERLVVNTGGREMSTIYLDVTRFMKDYMQVKAYYEGLDQGIDVPARQLKFKMSYVSSMGSPVKLDEETGFLTALHPGHALLEVSLRGVSTFECVEIVQDSAFSTVENCADLLLEKGKVPQPRADKSGSNRVPLIAPQKK